jgi:hypothetical protein
MNTSTFEAGLDDFERRVKPKVEDAAFCEAAESHPETPSTHNTHSICKLQEVSQQSSVVESSSIIDIMPCSFSTSHQYKSDGLVHSGDAPRGSDSIGWSLQSAPSVPSIAITADAAVVNNCHGLGDQSSHLPSPHHLPATSGLVVCSGGVSGQCPSPHLPVKVKGMCKTCYSRDYYHRFKDIQPGTPPMKSQGKLRPNIDPMILCDDFGAPILDKFGVPIQVTHILCPVMH